MGLVIERRNVVMIVTGSYSIQKLEIQKTQGGGVWGVGIFELNCGGFQGGKT